MLFSRPVFYLIIVWTHGLCGCLKACPRNARVVHSYNFYENAF